MHCELNCVSGSVPRRVNTWIVLAALSLTLPLSTTAAAGMFDRRPVVGTVENVGLDDADVIVKARIDTGAGLASVNAEIVEVKKNGAKERIRFKVIDKDGNSKTLERDVVEWVNIKNKGETGAHRRPVVRMDFCLGGKKIEARANLADRKNFLYPVLIGRNVLKTGNYMVDPTQKFISDARCK